MSQASYKWQPPRADAKSVLEARKALHAGLNEFITDRGGWLVSIAGDPTMRFEALPGSTLPDALRELGYNVHPAGSTSRVLPHGITETIAAERSSMPPVRIVHHAGIVQTSVYGLTIPPGAQIGSQ